MGQSRFSSQIQPEGTAPAASPQHIRNVPALGRLARREQLRETLCGWSLGGRRAGKGGWAQTKDARPQWGAWMGSLWGW